MIYFHSASSQHERHKFQKKRQNYELMSWAFQENDAANLELEEL